VGLTNGVYPPLRDAKNISPKQWRQINRVGLNCRAEGVRTARKGFASLSCRCMRKLWRDRAPGNACVLATVRQRCRFVLICDGPMA
jgi:hypothetical protein